MSISEKYQLTEELGGQSKRKFGRVFLVQSRATGEKFILKSLKKNTQNNHLQLRLKNESSFLFESDFLPKVIEYLESDDEIMLILQYKEGKTLDEYWKSVKRKYRLDFIKKLTEALVPIFEELNDKSIVHCDIKPSNILIQENEGELKVHLLDFGMAINTNNQYENKLLFPLGYAAPELILNRINCINHTSDIFSFGIVIWRLFEGKLPLSHPNPSVFTNLQITYPIPESKEMGKELNLIIKKICFKHQFAQAPNLMKEETVDALLQTAIEERYKTFTDVNEALQKIELKKSWFNRILS